MGHFHKFLAVLCSSVLCSCSQPSLSQPQGALIRQQTIHQNSCGPCALVHSAAYASSDWRKGGFFSQSLPSQVDVLINTHGKKQSVYKGARWKSHKGMRSADLAATANELLPHPIRHISQLIDTSHSPYQQLEKLHRHLSGSIAKGFPPILSFKQQVHKKFKSQEAYYWTTTKGHFISVIQVSPMVAEGFQFRYVDSLTGSELQGEINSRANPILTTSPITRKPITHKLNFPQLNLPRQKLTNGSFLNEGTLTHDLDSIIIAK